MLCSVSEHRRVHSVSVIASKTGLENMAELRAMWLFSSSALHCTQPSSPSRALDHCRSKQREFVCWWGAAAGENPGLVCAGAFLLLSPESEVTLLQATGAFPTAMAGPKCCLLGIFFHCTGCASTLSAHLTFHRSISRITCSPLARNSRLTVWSLMHNSMPK